MIYTKECIGPLPGSVRRIVKRAFLYLIGEPVRSLCRHCAVCSFISSGIFAKPETAHSCNRHIVFTSKLLACMLKVHLPKEQDKKTAVNRIL